MASLQETTKSGRVHIGLFGRRNVGKSSLINRLTKQNIALVSDVPGTTTDPVFKAMELLPLGPVMFIDTAGIDDVGALGEQRIGKTREVMSRTDIALVLIDQDRGFSDFERQLLSGFKDLGVPVIVVMNKIDRTSEAADKAQSLSQAVGQSVFAISAQTGQGLEQLRQEIVRLAPQAFEERPLIRDLLQAGDLVVFCVPIDSAAPKGRLILPQVQATRDALDAGASVLIAKENELAAQIANLKTPPRLVVTDSQVFKKADADTPKDIALTSFSILMARQRGDLESLAEGAKAIDRLKPGDKVLIAEACTHQCQAEDIGRVKIPRWLEKTVGGPLDFEWYTGDSFPEDVSAYQLVVHCGACMINRRAMLWRQKVCKDAAVPIVNYGVAISRMTGVLDRAMSPFKKKDSTK